MGLFDDPNNIDLMGALGGMSQGFAQAAMPSRMPVPFGAALGMGAGGAMTGLAQGMQINQARQAAQKTALENQFAQAAMPARMNLLNAAGNMGVGGGGSMPFGVPQQGAGSVTPGNTDGPAAQPMPNGVPTAPQVPQQPQGGFKYALDPRTLQQAGMYALASGQDRAAAGLFSNAQSIAQTGRAIDSEGNVAIAPGAAKALYGTAAATSAGMENGKLPGQEAFKTYSTNEDIRGHATNIQSDNTGKLQNVGSSDQPIWNTPAGVVGGGNGGASTPVAALSSIQDPGAQRMAVNAALSSGLPPAAWPAWIASLHTESGWNMAAKDGAAGEIGPGQIKPGTGAMFGYTPGQLRDPQTNLIASAKYFGQKWTQSNADPAKSMTGYNAGNINATPGDYATVGMRRLSGFGAPPQSPGVAFQPTPGGGVAVQNTTKTQDTLYEHDTKENGELSDHLQQGQANAMRVLQQRDIARGLGGTMGASGETRAAISNYLETYLPGSAAKFMEKVGNLPPAAQAQEFAKLALTGAGQDEQKVLGTRGGYQAINMFKSASPSLNMQSNAVEQMYNARLVAQQIDTDYIQGRQSFVQQNGQAWRNRSANYQPASDFDTQWDKQPMGRIGAASIAAINRAPYDQWSHGLSPQQQAQALSLITRADPTAQAYGPGGVLHGVAPAQQAQQ